MFFRSAPGRLCFLPSLLVCVTVGAPSSAHATVHQDVAVSIFDTPAAYRSEWVLTPPEEPLFDPPISQGQIPGPGDTPNTPLNSIIHNGDWTERHEWGATWPNPGSPYPLFFLTIYGSHNNAPHGEAPTAEEELASFIFNAGSDASLNWEKRISHESHLDLWSGVINYDALAGPPFRYNFGSLTGTTTARHAAVPGPLPILGTFAAFGFSRKIRRRIFAGLRFA
jgi:hypothetical protein